MQHLHARRAALGGLMPRRVDPAVGLPVPPMASYAQFAIEANGKEMSTTMALAPMRSPQLRCSLLPVASLSMVALTAFVVTEVRLGQLEPPERTTWMASWVSKVR